MEFWNLIRLATSTSLEKINMDSTDIQATMKDCSATRRYFIGVFAADRLPHYVRQRPALLICNLQEHFLPGNHWVTFFLPLETTGAEYFCSLGEAPTSPYFNRFIARHGGLIKSSTRPLQSTTSDVCGEFACVFALFRSVGLTYQDIVNKFGKNRLFNDNFVLELFNRTFTCEVHFKRPALRQFHAQSCSPQCHADGRQRCASRSSDASTIPTNRARAQPPTSRARHRARRINTTGVLLPRHQKQRVSPRPHT